MDNITPYDSNVKYDDGAPVEPRKKGRKYSTCTTCRITKRACDGVHPCERCADGTEEHSCVFDTPDPIKRPHLNNPQIQDLLRRCGAMQCAIKVLEKPMERVDATGPARDWGDHTTAELVSSLQAVHSTVAQYRQVRRDMRTIRNSLPSAASAKKKMLNEHFRPFIRVLSKAERVLQASLNAVEERRVALVGPDVEAPTIEDEVDQLWPGKLRPGFQLPREAHLASTPRNSGPVGALEEIPPTPVSPEQLVRMPQVSLAVPLPVEPPLLAPPSTVPSFHQFNLPNPAAISPSVMLPHPNPIAIPPPLMFPHPPSAIADRTIAAGPSFPSSGVEQGIRYAFPAFPVQQGYPTVETLEPLQAPLSADLDSATTDATFWYLPSSSSEATTRPSAWEETRQILSALQVLPQQEELPEYPRTIDPSLLAGHHVKHGSSAGSTYQLPFVPNPTSRKGTYRAYY